MMTFLRDNDLYTLSPNINGKSSVNINTKFYLKSWCIINYQLHLIPESTYQNSLAVGEQRLILMILFRQESLIKTT